MSPCPAFSTSQTAPGKQCSAQTKQKGLVDFCENGMVSVVVLNFVSYVVSLFLYDKQMPECMCMVYVHTTYSNQRVYNAY